MNIASAREIRILEMAERVNDMVGNPAGIKYLPRRKWDTKNRLLASIDRAKDLLGYDPSTGFEEGLEITVQWFHDNWDEICACAEFPPGMSAAVPGFVARVQGEKSSEVV